MHQSHLNFLYSIAAAIPYKTGNCKSKWAKPGTFTNVGAHLDFIKREMACDDKQCYQPKYNMAEIERSNSMCLQFPIKLIITLLVTYFISITWC